MTLAETTKAVYKVRLRKLLRAAPLLTDEGQKKLCMDEIDELCRKLKLNPQEVNPHQKPGRPIKKLNLTGDIQEAVSNVGGIDTARRARLFRQFLDMDKVKEEEARLDLETLEQAAKEAQVKREDMEKLQKANDNQDELVTLANEKLTNKTIHPADCLCIDCEAERKTDDRPTSK